MAEAEGRGECGDGGATDTQMAVNGWAAASERYRVLTGVAGGGEELHQQALTATRGRERGGSLVVIQNCACRCQLAHARCPPPVFFTCQWQHKKEQRPVRSIVATQTDKSIEQKFHSVPIGHSGCLQPNPQKLNFDACH